MKTAKAEKPIQVWYKWVEKDGDIYYVWRLENEKEWHYKLTAYKEVPVVMWEWLSQAELNDLQPSDSKPSVGHSKAQP